MGKKLKEAAKAIVLIIPNKEFILDLRQSQTSEISHILPFDCFQVCKIAALPQPQHQIFILINFYLILVENLLFPSFHGIVYCVNLCCPGSSFAITSASQGEDPLRLH